VTRAALPAILIGLILAATLLASHDLPAILRVVEGAGWGLALVIALHLPQTVLSGLGQGALLAPRVGVGLLFRLRWVREAVNALLPVAQLGGDVVRARLLMRHGAAPVAAAASGMVDLSGEMAGQVVFTIAGVALLLLGAHGGGVIPVASALIGAVALLALALALGQRFGLAALIERLVARGTASGKWPLSADLTGLGDAVTALYRRPRRFGACLGWHLLSWIAGGFETFAAMAVLGLHPTIREAMVMEALGQAVRSAGFLIPGALGVQEGGFLVIGAMIGIDARGALALSLVKRLRELALGLPGLALWHRMERRRAPAPVAAA
jgi:putative membrane protein